MQTIKVIFGNMASSFEKEVQDVLDSGYKISSSYCGESVYLDGSTEPCYKVILIKEI